MAQDLTTVGVVGLGTMGAGIAEVFARSGLDVVAVELDPSALQRGQGHVERSTGRAVSRGRLSAEDQQAIVRRIRYSTSLDDLAAVDVVIEAVPERIDVKRALFGRLDRICPPSTILASNTSSLSITEIAAATDRPGQVIGMHFFNPAPVMKLVEIVHSVLTDADVVDDVRELIRRLGKTGVSVGDRAGFVANRLLFGYLNQAAAMLESHWATRADIDLAMTLGAGLPMGPLALLDLIGLDTSVQILDTVYAETRDRRHAVAPMLRHLVTAGHLGRKSGRGIYDYGQVESTVDDTIGRDPRAALHLGVVADGSTSAIWTDGSAAVVAPDQLTDLAECDIIVDAAGGTADETRARWMELGRVASPTAILVTTSRLTSVLECATAAGRPARVVGARIHQRRGDQTLAEMVRTAVVDDGAVQVAVEGLRSLGLSVVHAPDRAGLIVDALRLPHLNDALAMVEDGYANADDIDAAMCFGCGYPVGPIAMLDALGLDVALVGLDAIYDEQREPGLAPTAMLRHLVHAGRIGRGDADGVRPRT